MSSAAAVQPGPANSAPTQQRTGHPFACGDFSRGKVLLVLADGKVDWEYPAPHVIEVTPQKKVVWTFADHQTMKTIATIQLLDVPGDATRGEILH